jgi:hypothetical protein
VRSLWAKSNHPSGLASLSVVARFGMGALSREIHFAGSGRQSTGLLAVLGLEHRLNLASLRLTLTEQVIGNTGTWLVIMSIGFVRSFIDGKLEDARFFAIIAPG